MPDPKINPASLGVTRFLPTIDPAGARFRKEEKIQGNNERMEEARGFADRGNLLGILEALSRIDPFPTLLTSDMIELLITGSKQHEALTQTTVPSMQHETFRFRLDVDKPMTITPTFENVLRILPRDRKDEVSTGSAEKEPRI